MKKYRSFFPLLLMGIAAFSCRFMLAYLTFSSTRDTSVVGLMAMHIREGAHPLFYYGQAYMGALEAYCTALFFQVFGTSPTVLALTPICFGTGWCIASFFLFRRLFNRIAAGYAAAIYVAIGSLYHLWFTTASYGGYPEIYCIGTLTLLLSIRLAEQKQPPRIAPWILLGSLGFLGIWINMQIMPYFLVSAIVLVASWHSTNSGKKEMTISMILAAAIACCGLIPSLYISSQITGTEQMTYIFSHIPQNTMILLYKVIPPLLFWPQNTSLLIKSIATLSVGIPVIGYLFFLARQKRKLLHWLPFLFVLLFLAMYLPHQLASKPAARYLISPAMMLICAGFASLVSSSRVFIRRTGWFCLMVWTCYNCSFLVNYLCDKQQQKDAVFMTRNRIINKARQAGLTNIKIVGTEADGLLSANLSFASQDRIHFINSQDERILANHLLWHLDENAGYGFRNYWRPLYTNTLLALGLKNPQIMDDNFLMLAPPERPRQSFSKTIPYSIIKGSGIEGPLSVLHDSSIATAATILEQTDTSLTLQLKEVQPVGGMRFFPRKDNASLPQRGYTISLSLEGKNFTPVLTCPGRIATSYFSGNRLYLMDHYGAQDHVWPAQDARYVQIQYQGKKEQHTAFIGEILLFATTPISQPARFDKEINAIADLLAKNAITFTWADRYISSELSKRRGKDLSTAILPPVDIRFLKTNPSREITTLKNNEAFVIAQGMADISETLLKESTGNTGTLKTIHFTHYSVILPPPHNLVLKKRLFWNGHMLFLDE